MLNMNNSISINDIKAQQAKLEQAYTTALLRSLQFSGVKFIRYLMVDSSNNIRAKVKPIDFLLRKQALLDNQASIAKVCVAGMTSYEDSVVPGTGLSAKDYLVLQPDISTFRILPYAPTTAVVMANLKEPFSNGGGRSSLDTRHILQAVMDKAAAEHQIEFSVGVELEFCLVDASSHEIVDRTLYSNTNTLNDQEAYIIDLYEQLEQQQIPVELIHAESGPGQLEVVLRHTTNPLTMADNVVLARETIRNVSQKHLKKALFLPKYEATQAGNGAHIHISFHKVGDATEQSLLSVPNEPLALSTVGGQFVEGILRHLSGLMALTSPTANSFRRVGPGCWTGSAVAWGIEDKESPIRVCCNSISGELEHVEYKLSDHSCNIYMAMASILGAGLDGIVQQVELRPSLEELADKGVTQMEALPNSLEDALDALEKDSVLLEVLGCQLSQAYLPVRRQEAVRSSQMKLDDEVQEALARA
eukprot:Nitzschia sp. Nitz4//scaffold280_size24494//7710//9206//NITZ4_008391-RA/size24494-snap-gene-0.36-mRNA-1//1//CDS//3329545588//8587//frame0